MTRRFRRRPSTAVYIVVALAVVVLARYTYDRATQRPGVATSAFLQEGGCEVIRVIDGDSLVVRQTAVHSQPGKRLTNEATIRLLGINCPEFDEPWGDEATAMTRRLLDRRTVVLRFDRRRLDRYQRFLAYVMVDDLLVNTALVRAGLARADVYPGDSQAMGRKVKQAEQEAKAARRGIWTE